MGSVCTSHDGGICCRVRRREVSSLHASVIIMSIMPRSQSVGDRVRRLDNIPSVSLTLFRSAELPRTWKQIYLRVCIKQSIIAQGWIAIGASGVLLSVVVQICALGSTHTYARHWKEEKCTGTEKYGFYTKCDKIGYGWPPENYLLAVDDFHLYCLRNRFH